MPEKAGSTPGAAASLPLGFGAARRHGARQQGAGRLGAAMRIGGARDAKAAVEEDWQDLRP